MTGNEQARARGEVDQADGDLKEGLADVRDALDSAKDKAGDALRRLTGN